METALGSVVTSLTAAAGTLTDTIPTVAGLGIGVGLLGFGIAYVVHIFKRMAH